MDCDPHVCGCDVGVLFEKVFGEDAGEEFGGVDRVEFGHDVGRLLLGVGCYDVGVIGVCPRGRDVAFEHGADGHFSDGLGAIGVAVGFVEADVVFAVAGVGEGRHGDWYEAIVVFLR